MTSSEIVLCAPVRTAIGSYGAGQGIALALELL